MNGGGDYNPADGTSNTAVFDGLVPDLVARIFTNLPTSPKTPTPPRVPKPSLNQFYACVFLHLACGVEPPQVLKSEGKQSSIPDQPEGKVTIPSNKWWKEQGVDPHEIKDGQGGSRRNLGVDKNGNIWSVDRRGSGNPQYEGNIRDYQ